MKLIQRFRYWTIASVVCFFLVVLAGGIVRSTGAGMGCPDWPRCFGQYIPPTAVEQLPNDYKIHYAELRRSKNERLVGYLRALGQHELADRLLHDPSLYEEQDFNALKTWTEYINRLVGALSGLVLLITTIFAVRLWQIRRLWSMHCVGALLLLLFQAWIGSIVVSTNLLPGMITLHMLLAMALIGWMLWLNRSLAAYLYANSKKATPVNGRQWLLTGLWMGLCILLSWQVVEGTGVREMIDEVAARLGSDARQSWAAELGGALLNHRNLSWLVLAWALLTLWKSLSVWTEGSWQHKVSLWVVVGLLFEAVMGMYLAWWGMPSALQPLHLLVAILLWALSFDQFLFLLWHHRTKVVRRVEESQLAI